jgi:hypothetical protein
MGRSCDFASNEMLLLANLKHTYIANVLALQHGITHGSRGVAGHHALHGASFAELHLLARVTERTPDVDE